MATYYWVNGAGNWNDFDATHWSLTSGGAGFAGVPTLADDVIFNGSSGAANFTVTLQYNTVNPRCYNLTVSRPTGFTISFTNSSATALEVYGPTISIGAAGSAGITLNAFALTCSFNGIGTFLCSPSHRFNPLTFSGTASSWTLGSNLTAASGALGIVVAASFNTSASNYSITAGSFTSSNTNTRTLTFNASQITLQDGFDVSTSTNLTVNGGTAIFYMAATSSFKGGGKTYYRCELTTFLTGFTVTGANTFTQFYMPGRGFTYLGDLTFDSNQTIGTLSLNVGAGAGSRQRIMSSSGSPITLTVGTFTAADELDFYNITVAGAASPISGNRYGNCGGNTGITFPAAKNVYWSSTSAGNWSNATWALTSGGAGSAANFPLAQDTVIFDAPRPTSGTIGFDYGWSVGNINLSARASGSSPMTLSGFAGVYIFGNWTGGSGITQTGLTHFFLGNTNTTLTSGGAQWGGISIGKDSGASVTLQDTLTASGTRTFSLVKGTFNVNNQTVTYNTFSSNNSNTRSLILGNGTFNLNQSDSGFFGTSSLTITSTFGGKIAFIGSGSPSILGGAITFGCIVSIEANVTLTVYTSNTFNTLQSTATGCTVRFTAATTNTFVNDFALLSNGGTVTLSCATGGLTYTLSKATGTVVVKGCTISGSNATGGATWLAPTSAGNVDGGTNTGWSFITGTVYSDAVTEAQTSIDALACSLRYDASITENNSIADNDDANLAFPVSVTEGQTIADSDSVTDYWAVINTTQSPNWTPVISI